MTSLSIGRDMEKGLPSAVTAQLYQRATGHMLEAELQGIDDAMACAEEIQLTVGGDYAKKLLNRAHYAAYTLEDSLEVLEALQVRISKAEHGPTTRIRTWTQAQQVLESAAGVSALNRKELFYGREEEEKAIRKLLSQPEDDGRKVKVIEIRGEAGVGKTALAGHIYFNAGVVRSFRHRVWVTLSHGASVCDVVVKILEAVNEEDRGFFSENNDLRALLSKLEMHLAGRKFLLVLDNCCIKDNSDNWDKMIGSLGLNGSAIIMLTENPEYEGFVPPADHSVPLLPLPLLDCHSILLDHAGVEVAVDPTSDESDFVEAENEGLKIVNQLGNLPLAAKMVGSFLLDKDPDFWIQTLRDERLNTKRHENSQIPSFIIMCYLDLPVAVRRCFTFLSVFPKGYRFQRKQVVLLWMALGFLRQSRLSGKSMEEVGDKYFDYLTLRSFFQRLGDGVSFLIHDMVHDLASYMFKESCENLFLYHGSIEDFRVEVFTPLLLRGIWLQERPRKLLPAQVVEKELSKLNPSAFRVLSLSSSITELPPSIGKLKNLHYLDLSCTTLQVLPDSVGDLSYLQTLLLINCTLLSSLPETVTDLANLRLLDIRGTGVQEMPKQMGKLTSLQTLTDFVVSRSSQGFQDLEGLSAISTLAISNLHNMVNATEASYAKLEKKKSLNDLTLRWGISQDSSEIGPEVLENLKPHKNIKHLTIENYCGVQFPGWLGDERFKTLRTVKLQHCDCTSLPPLGRLQGLKDLVIEGFHKVTHVGPEFCGWTSGSKAFGSLETLQFRDMPEWEEWKILEDAEFGKLRELSVICCPKLVKQLPKKLVELEKLEISGCYVLVPCLPDHIRPTCTVYVNESNEALMKRALEVPNCRRRLIVPVGGKQFTPYSFPSVSEGSHDKNVDIQESDVSPLKEQSPAVEAHDPLVTWSDTPATEDNFRVATSSSEDEQSCFDMLKISNISQLEEKLPSKVDSLRIEDCAYLDALPESFLPLMQTLKELYLIDCNSFTSFPPHEFFLSLATLYVNNCPKLELFPASGTTQKFKCLEHLCVGNSCDSLKDFTLDISPKLRTVCLWGCSNLVSIIISENFQGLAWLESLEIMDCPNLESFSTGGLPIPNLASLLVSNCQILKNIPNFKNSLLSLQSLIIRHCPALESCAMVALPSSLTSLSISFSDKLMPQKCWGMHNLQNLSSFELEGGCMDMESFPEEKLLPSNINTLRISTLPSLKRLDNKGFKHLSALQELEIDGCEQLQSLPEEGLPSSLLYLCIKQSPLLTKKLTSKAGEDWDKAVHIPHIEIDGEVMCITIKKI